MRVLAFTPTYGAGPAAETLASVAGQQFAGEIVREVSWHNPHEGASHKNVFAQYLRGRQMALDGDYDALWTVEHDMQVPENALQRLWDTDTAVAYGVYLLRHGNHVLNAWEYLPGSRNLGESLSVQPDKLAEAIKREIVRVSGVGFGCTLIRRETLERIPFRSGGPGSEAPDMPFAVDCVRAKVRQVAHFGVLCGHWEDTRWIWPLRNATSDLVHLRANTAVTVRAAGETRRLVAGAEYDLPAGDAWEWQRAGYVTILGA